MASTSLQKSALMPVTATTFKGVTPAEGRALDAQIEQVLRMKELSEPEVEELTEKTRAILLEESNATPVRLRRVEKSQVQRSRGTDSFSSDRV
eukprot:g8731.t1